MELDFKKINLNYKEILLSKWTAKQIYEFFLNEPIVMNKFYKSNLRYIDDPKDEDKTPSLSFKKDEEGSMIFQDWGRGYKGDVFKYIEFYYKARYVDLQFNDLCKKALEDIEQKTMIKSSIKYITKVHTKKRKLACEVDNYFYHELKYWLNYHISVPTLTYFNVVKVKAVYDAESGMSLFYATKNNPIFMYQNLGKSGKSFQLYRPLMKNKELKFRNEFVSNDNVIFGLNQLPEKGKILIITKSMKDVMCLYEQGITAIGVPTEGYTIPLEIMEDLKERFDKIVVLFDNDVQGEKASATLTRHYNLLSRFIPKHFNAKDPAEFYKNHKGESERFFKACIDYLSH